MPMVSDYTNGVKRVMMPYVNGEDLKRFRDNLGMTQQELAIALGVDRNTVARWERDERTVPPFLHLALQTIERQQLATKKKPS